MIAVQTPVLQVVSLATPKKRKASQKKTKRGSTASVSDSDRKRVRVTGKSIHKERSPLNITRKTVNSREKRAFTPPKKVAPSKILARKKSLSPSVRRRNTTPTNASKAKASTSKTIGSRYNQSPRPIERKDKHKRSLSPRPRLKDRSPRRQDQRARRKESPEPRARNTSRTRQPDARVEDRKKDDDRSRNKEDRRPDRKPVSDRDRRDHDDARAREKAREAAREKEREEALERCRERQREREQLAKEKERNRERLRDDRDKDSTKQRDFDKSIAPIITISTHNQADRKLSDRDRDRANKDRKDRDKIRDKEKERDRLYERNIDRSDRNRPLEKDRVTEKLSERDRDDKERPRGRENFNDRNRDKNDKDKNFGRDRNFDRNVGDLSDRNFDRDKERPSKGLVERNKDRDFDRDKDRGFDRIADSRRPFDKLGERDRTSLEKDRNIVRDRGIDRVMELRERNKSLDRGRAPDAERGVDRNRERYDREGRFDKRALAADDKGFESPYDSRRDRSRYAVEGSERGSIFKEISPSREDARGLRHIQGFNEDRRSRGSGRDIRGGVWEQRGGYDENSSSKTRDWDYPESRREWDSRSRHGDWEGAVEGEDWGRCGGGGGGEWGSDWRDDWQHRPSRHPPREDQTIVSANHIIVREANNEDSGGRRQVLDSGEKDHIGGDFKKEALESGNLLEMRGHKRPREDTDKHGDSKKPRLDDPLPSAILEEALSDISDDPDEILNREDLDVTPQDSDMINVSCRSSSLPTAQDLEQRILEDRPSEEDNIDNLDFEEISDEELEEEARANKGLGDALGVDWASLVAESRPRQAEVEPGAARKRWQPDSILARIGVSKKYAGQELFEQIQERLSDKKNAEESNKPGLLHPVAAIHTALRESQSQRRSLFSGTDLLKRALSARADLAIRRQLCNLPVASLELQQASGFCQWVV